MHLLAPAVVGGVVVYLAALEVAGRLSADTPPISALRPLALAVRPEGTVLHIVQVGPLPCGHGDAVLGTVTCRPTRQVALGVRPPPLVATVLVAPMFLRLSRQRLSSLVGLPAGGRCRRPLRRLLLPVPVLLH